MKKYILLLVCVICFSCKNEKTSSSEKAETTIKAVSEAIVPPILRWTKNEISISETPIVYNQEEVFSMVRNNAQKPAYVSFQNVKIYNGSTYKISVVVKKGSEGFGFAIRTQSVYPNRVDTLFDLDKGKVIATKISGKDLAENNKATIENLGDDWFKCSVYSDLYEDQIRVVMGPTNASINPTIWETKTDTNNSVYIVPSTLKIEEF